MPIIKLPADFKSDSKSHIANLHTALTHLEIPIAAKAIAEKKIEATTTDAIKKIQKEFKIRPDGKLNEKTIVALNTGLHDKFITNNKYRTSELHSVFEKLKLNIDKEEKIKRHSGESTRKAIETFQKNEGLPVDGKLSEDVLIKMHDSIVKNRFYSPAKNQRGILHATIQKVNKISKLNLEIDANEIKKKELGDTSVKFIKAFQEKYKLPVTGEVNKATLDKINSVAASKGTFVKKISTPPVLDLKTVTKELRLNTVSPKVAELQKQLSFLGYKISENEFKSQTFGNTTTKALSDLQKKNGIAITGHYDRATIAIVNKVVSSANPRAVGEHRYRIRGSVRDQLWQRKNNMVIKVYELILEKESAEPLAAKKIFLNGFFDIAYDAPINTVNGQMKDKFHIVVKLYTAVDQNNPVAIQKHFNVNQIHWVNFTESKNADGTTNFDGKYLGESEYQVTRAVLQKALGAKQIIDVKETAADKQISQLSLQTGLSTDDIMRLVLSDLVAKEVNMLNPLSTEVFYAFVAQNLPPDLPGDLLRGTSDWETIGHLVELTSSGIAFLEVTLQQQAIENAVSQNLVSQKIKVNRDAIVQSLATLRTSFTLSKPILTGNGNLQSLLDSSTVSAANHAAVANVFINNKGINSGFWTEIKTLEQQIGADKISDFTNTVEVANISKNHIPTVQFLKNNTGAGKMFNAPSAIAKLDQAGLVNLINQNPGEKVPAGFPGNTDAEKITNYAAALKSRAEFLYPAVALAATVRRNSQKIQNINEVQNFIDTNNNFDFRTQNIDKFLLDNNIRLDVKIVADVKIVQRVHKITTDAAAGSALIDSGLHSSMQIYFMGKDRLTSLMTGQNIDPKLVNRIYESSKMKYLQILHRLIDFRRETNNGTPGAIGSNNYTDTEIQQALGDIPNLDALFGSLDYCDCEHCKSLYGPAAYLTDMLRFLKMHDSLIVKPAPNPTNEKFNVKDILFDRRPDIGNILLNCENTDTPLPYIDLVCEILENNMEPQNKNFDFQTTLTQKELRAIPEHIRPFAYTTLAGADFPMNNSFNLFQEETRTYLNYLRVPRFELMEAFQDKSNLAAKIPDDNAIAAEYFSISSKEKDLIITQRLNPIDQNRFWGLDTTQNRIAVSLFMKRTKLNYNELLELLLVKFVNDPAISKSEIERPVDTCDTDVQVVTNLTASKFDLMHRFIRLWRKTGWKMWELDLLLRNLKIGNNLFNADALNNLKRFKLLHEKLKLPFEILLTFYGDINSEIRIKPEKPDVTIKPLYDIMFQNIAVTNPIDAKFTLLTLDPSIILGLNNAGTINEYTPVPTILSALALRQTDFDLLVAKTNNHLSLVSLSALLRYAYLSRSLKLNVQDLIVFLSINNNADPFVDLQTTLDCIKKIEFIKASGLSLNELDYILNYRPDSPVGLRDETIAQRLEGLRKILATNKENIDKLKLSVADRNNILAFNANSLVPMTDPQLTVAFIPFQTILKNVSANFIAASFSADETNYIIRFNTVAITASAKTKLIDAIKTLQNNLKDLLNQNANQIKSQVSSSFTLSDEQSNILINNLSISGINILQKLEDETLITKNPDGSDIEINTANARNFMEHFKCYLLLHKVALLVSKMKIETNNLEWFIINNTAVNTIDFSVLPLPLSLAVTPNQYDNWNNLFLFLQFKSKFPEPENASIRSILDLAKNPASTKPDIVNQIARLTQWDKDDITHLDTAFMIKPEVGHIEFTNAEFFLRLQKCFEQMKLTGVDATTMFKWAIVNDDPALEIITAVQTRNAVKSKYEQENWLQKITPLYDDIREKKRKALVEFHLENSQRNQAEKININGKDIPNPLYWKDANSLFKYFLIDVEMGACHLTSRIKQALSSVQLFVQRCFLNLENRYIQVTQDEKEDVASPNAWSQWKWMKNYRIWEANRKIFFYPENWLEPELRDDKSPFFEELENELMQNEITKENVESAFENYLHKVDEVSHLEVCGLYHEMENLAGDNSFMEINTVHVIGRTKAIPHIYHYRTYDMNYSIWSAWEKIDVDIQGDHAVPVVYNRKLHLFWLQFMEKPMKVKKVPPAQPSTSSNPQNSPEPMKIMEVQLGWSVKKSGGWSTKKISKQKLIHPWERPHYSYNLKPYYLGKFNELYLDIYISTSKEFNDEYFYDGYAKPENNPVKLSKNPFNETFLPWHSSSFIFNGEVKDIVLKALKGKYFIPNSNGSPANSPSDIDSFQYVHGNFGESGAITKNLQTIEFGPRLRLPGGMHFENNHLANNKIHSQNNSSLTVLENSSSPNLISGALSPFQLVITQQDLQLNTMATDHPVFYQDNQRAFFIKPEWEARLNNYGQIIGQNRKYHFFPFYHPYTMLFLREFNRNGIDGILNRKIQTSPETFAPVNNFDFNNYAPASSVVLEKDIKGNTIRKDIVDFSNGGAYSIYNWELFFHAPLMIACRLMQNQKFEDAMYWFHYIFNPTDIENYPTPQRYWVTKPFFEYNSDEYKKQRIESILTNINLDDKAEIGKMVAWKNNPFKPHLIARNRPVAYQKNIVMKYLDNLIAWGDMLFKRDTIESINEASLLYMLAYEILGNRPIKVPNVKHEELTFNELESKLDAFGNARVDVVIEDTLLPITVVPSSPGSGSEPIPKLDTFYFCIPNNDYLTKYWDTVEDRLFKIRNCMNIEGIVRQLPLFEPPIDPALLVKAAAAGIDLSSVLNDLAAPTPHYRFRIVVQKAIEFCNEVKMLGEKLLSTLEKKDVEQLSLLRSQHEIQLLEAVKEVRKKQIDEAVETIGSLNKAFELAEEKKSYYEGREYMNSEESAAAVLNIVSSGVQLAGGIVELISSFITPIPDFYVGAAGFGGSPVVVSHVGGGSKTASTLQAVARAAFVASNILDRTSGLVSTIGGYQRRKDEWDLQGRLATIEKDQIQFQINAAEIRQAIAELELDNQDLQIENAKTVDNYMRNKYTNQQLFSWMITQISTVYFQAYQLAFDMAKKAEKCYMYELGITESNIVQFGYWDSLKKGLLSGDKLMNDLRRLEAEYINQNKREFEITKHISLAQMSPSSLITLKETGQCTVSLPEFLFDMDYPGHYMRRIKNVSISIPCIVGPFTGINCTLSLLRNETRMDATLNGGAYAKVDETDTRFKIMFGAISSIATSSAQNDSGMFELNFNDERYLPFEGAGVISDWEISLPKENNYFDFASLSDVVLHISYTSRNGGGQLAVGANANVQTNLPTSTARLFSLKHEFATEWYKFLNPVGGADQELLTEIKTEHFPFFIRGKLSTIQIKKMDVFVESKIEPALNFVANIKVSNSASIDDIPVDVDLNYNSVPHASRNLTAASTGNVSLKIKISGGANFKSLTSDQVENIFILFQLG